MAQRYVSITPDMLIRLLGKRLPPDASFAGWSLQHNPGPYSLCVNVSSESWLPSSDGWVAEHEIEVGE